MKKRRKGWIAKGQHKPRDPEARRRAEAAVQRLHPGDISRALVTIASEMGGEVVMND